MHHIGCLSVDTDTIIVADVCGPTLIHSLNGCYSNVMVGYTSLRAVRDPYVLQ